MADLSGGILARSHGWLGVRLEVERRPDEGTLLLEEHGEAGPFSSCGPLAPIP